MKIFKILTLCIACAGMSYGQDSTQVRFTDRSDLQFELRGSLRGEMSDNRAAAHFKADYFRWNIEGTAGRNIRYRFRQSLTSLFSPNSLDNLIESVNYAFVTWQPFRSVSFTAGKNVFALGGHEFWAAPVHVIEFSDFGGSLAAYQMGLNVAWEVTTGQELVFQAANFRGTGDEDYYCGGLPDGVSAANVPFLYTVNWNGKFLDNALELRYSASYGRQAQKKDISIFALGQSYRRKKWGAYLDLVYSRQGLDANGLLSRSAAWGDGNPKTLQNAEYFSAITYLHLFICPSLSAFVKGIGETGGLFAPDGASKAGLYRFNWNTQACIQYMPTRDGCFKLFAHYSYYSRTVTHLGRTLGITSTDRHTLSLGVIYIMNVF